MRPLTFIPAFFLLINCSSNFTDNSKKSINGKSNKITTEHFNITIASDLSNRLNPKFYPKAVSDVEIVSVVSDNIYPKILTYKRSMNQLDQFRIAFINKSQIGAYNANTQLMDIDFAKFKTQAERISYLRKSYQKEKNQFMNEFTRIHNYAVKRPFGSDIWTYMQQGIDDFVVNNESSQSKLGKIDYINKHRNILILLTDGYIETKFANKGYDLTAKKINEFRTEYLKSGDKSIEQFFRKNPKYKINDLTNPLLKDLEVLVLELYDRTETTSGASIHPTDLEIMKLIWTDWLKKSKVKRVELHSKFSNKNEAEKIIMKFIGL